jgi:hypothetical protein
LLDRMRRELGDRFGTLELIASYNAGTPAIKRRGIFNVGYVSNVLYHLVGYEISAALSSPGVA